MNEYTGNAIYKIWKTFVYVELSWTDSSTQNNGSTTRLIFDMTAISSIGSTSNENCNRFAAESGVLDI